jgi:flagellar motor switch protein FliN/FliY
VGTVVELDRAVGAPADVLLNGRLIALGEVVVVDQEFAVRITRILDGADTTAR